MKDVYFEQDNKIFVSDLYLAAFLNIYGYKVINIVNNNNTIYFIYNKNKDIYNDISNYYFGEATFNPSKFVTEIKYLKEQIFQKKLELK
jgi:hypothetical protein